MSKLDDARKELRDFLEDMAALRPFTDVGNPEAAPFTDAFSAARARALAAATAYVDAAKGA
jgi:hypothetical protein